MAKRVAAMATPDATREAALLALVEQSLTSTLSVGFVTSSMSLTAAFLAVDILEVTFVAAGTLTVVFVQWLTVVLPSASVWTSLVVLPSAEAGVGVTLAGVGATAAAVAVRAWRSAKLASYMFWAEAVATMARVANFISLVF